MFIFNIQEMLNIKLEIGGYFYIKFKNFRILRPTYKYILHV